MTPKREDRKARPRALVTGGAIRLGRAIALGLAASGMDVAIGYHGSGAAARATVRELEAAGARALAVRADLADPRAARRLVTAAAGALDGLDVLVNSAARFARTPLATVSPARYDALLDVNLRGAFFCAQAAAAAMTSGGHIVNIGDVITELARPGWIPYTLSKAGIQAMTRGLAVELRPRGIAVNCVAPGAVLKPDRLPLARWRDIAKNHAGHPGDVVAAVVFFATCPLYITGQILRVDGGETA
ncbi:MAG TPA: SDR family oxidoreductase [Methylomirabilota bacterium]|nr:SDR family oxidoreductase [Methylomirabilota bacterium]